MSKEKFPEKDAFPTRFPTSSNSDWNVDGGLTSQEYAAIHLKVPNSGNEDLDNMILEARRLDLIESNIAALISNMSKTVNTAENSSALSVTMLAIKFANQVYPQSETPEKV